MSKAFYVLPRELFLPADLQCPRWPSGAPSNV